MQKVINNWERVILIILEIFQNYYVIEKVTLRTMFRMSHNCLIVYSVGLDFFVVFQDKLQNWLFMACYVLQHGWCMQSNCSSTV